MKKVKMLLIILCVAMMFFGFVGCKKDSATSSNDNSGSAPTTVASVDGPYPNGGGSPVPEPATLILLGSGLVGLAGIGRKKFFKKD